jgi:hypothetical protein
MIWLAFVSNLTLQTPYGLLEATPETYQPPVVRPFQPPSNFGRETAQGDGEDDLYRGPLDRPVVVDAYARSYETSQTDAEVAYEQGVAQAEIDAEARFGPLDGLWRVTGRDGEPLLELSLTDRGGGRGIEGAWRRLNGQAAIGATGPAATDGTTIIMSAAEGELRLQRSARGWTGDLVQKGRSRPVMLSRAG